MTDRAGVALAHLRTVFSRAAIADAIRRFRAGNVSLIAKITGALLGLLVVMTVVTGVVIRAGTVRLQRDIQALNDARRVQELAVTALALVYTQDDITKAMLLDPANLELAVEKIEAHERNATVYAAMDSLSRSAALTSLIQRLRSMDEERLAPIDARVLDAMASGDMPKATQVYFTEYTPVRASYAELVRNLGTVADSSAAAASTQATAGARQAFVRIALTLVVGMGIIGALVLVAGRRLRRDLGETVRVLEAVAGGDLTRRLAVASRDEIGRMGESLNQTVHGLRAMIARVQGMSGELADHSHKLSAVADETTGAVLQLNVAIEQITSGAQEQARATQETVAVMGEMSASVRGVAEGADSLATSASRTVEAARSGADAVHAAIRGMEEIRDRVLDTGEKIRSLGGQSERIDDISRVMAHLAAQTKLLALNAAIEAARAGEHGRGFAVVAEEVGRLAMHSAQSSHEIAGLIRDIREEVGNVVSAMSVSTERVQQGMQLSHRTVEALEGILGSAEGTNAQLARLAESARDMAGRITRVTDLVHTVATVAEESAAAAEEMAAQSAEVEHHIAALSATGTATEAESPAPQRVSARTLVRMAQQLREAVAGFSV